jgi:hypothetical protein
MEPRSPLPYSQGLPKSRPRVSIDVHPALKPEDLSLLDIRHCLLYSHIYPCHAEVCDKNALTQINTAEIELLTLWHCDTLFVKLRLKHV